MRGANTLSGAVLFAYVLWFRTHDITQSFALGGDQMRDWQMALHPFWSLPLSGVSSTAGGSTIGPAYYWFMWIVARIIGPFADNLPHAGGIGVALMQSTGDLSLFLALASRLRSWPTALLVVLTVATSGYDATLSSTIWNPPVAAALVKVALAALLWKSPLTWPLAVTTVAASWLAVHCHTTAIVVAGPAIAWVVVEPLVARTWRLAGVRAALALAIVFSLQLPWLMQAARHPDGERSDIVRSIDAFAAAPGETLRLRESATFVADGLEFILVAPAAMPYFGLLLVTSSVVLLLVARDAALLVSGFAPLVTAVALFAVWQGRLDQAYWLLVLSPSAAIALFAWIPRVHPRAWIVSVAFLAILLVAQPARARMAWSFHRMPGYGAIVEGCRTLARQGRAVREVRLGFTVPAKPDPLWLCSLLGVTVDAPAPVAVIDRAGRVRFE